VKRLEQGGIGRAALVLELEMAAVLEPEPIFELAELGRLEARAGAQTARKLV
jgi:hypothetical protein